MALSRWRVVLRWVAFAAVALFLALQFVPVERSNPPVGVRLEAPAEIDAILRRACYDCHSHETSWPWYSRIAPVSWFVVDHVDHARADLNFSEWPVFDFDAQQLAFGEIEHEVADREMPLRSYTLLHRGARLDEAERRALVEWARSQH